jgi:hypothetical protein
MGTRKVKSAKKVITKSTQKGVILMSLTSLEPKGSSVISVPQSQNVELTADDIELGRLLLMQQTKPQGFDEAKFGDIHETVVGSRVAGFDSAVDVIPVQTQKFWRVWDSKEKKVVAILPASAQNMHLRQVTEYEGKAVQYFMVYRFYVLFARDLQKGGGMPYILDFKSTSQHAGKKINTQIINNKMRSKDPLSGTVVKLSSMKSVTNGNTYAVFITSPGRETTAAELEMCKQWQSMLAGKKVVTEEDVE